MGSVADPQRSELAISVGRVSLCAPFIIAAGPWSAGDELTPSLIIEAASAGALISKTVTLHPREGNKEPTIRAVSGGLVNRVGLRNPGVAKFITGPLAKLLALQVPVLVSVAAQEPIELGALLAQLEAQTDPGQVVGYELNASCPNISGEPPGPAQLTELLTAARQETRRPLWVKLGYADRTTLVQRALSCAAGGADALVAINTVPALVIAGDDGESTRPGAPELIPFLGGLSGASLHPLALRAVWELHHAQPLPVIGCGGVGSLAAVLAFFAVGAQAIQLGSALYPSATANKPPVLPALRAQLAQYLADRGQTSLTSYLQEHA